MSFLWSENAAHILTLFSLPSEVDGYSETELYSTEAELGLELPQMLRAFYKSYGKRHLLESNLEGLAAPSQSFLNGDWLIFGLVLRIRECICEHFTGKCSSKRTHRYTQRGMRMI